MFIHCAIKSLLNHTEVEQRRVGVLLLNFLEKKEITDAEQAIEAAKAQFEAIEKEAVNVLKAFELAQKSQAEKKEHLEAVEKAYAKEKKKNVDREGELAQLEEKETVPAEDAADKPET